MDLWTFDAGASSAATMATEAAMTSRVRMGRFYRDLPNRRKWLDPESDATAARLPPRGAFPRPRGI